MGRERVGTGFPLTKFSEKKRLSWRELEAEIVQANDDEKLKAILKELPVASLALHIMNSRKNSSPLVLDFLKNVLEDAGLYVRPGDVERSFTTIDSFGIPVKREDTGRKIKINGREYSQSYTVIFTQHTDRIIKALKENPVLFARLNDNPVKLTCGPEVDRLPKTTQLANRQGYVSVGGIIIEKFGIMVYRNENNNLLVGSPVSILSTLNGNYCSLEDLKKLLPFLEQRLRELGRIK